MLIASNLFYKQQLLLHLTASSYFLQTVRIELTIVSSILAVYRKLYLAFLTHIARLTIYSMMTFTKNFEIMPEDFFCQVQFLNLRFQDLQNYLISFKLYQETL